MQRPRVAAVAATVLAALALGLGGVPHPPAAVADLGQNNGSINLFIRSAQENAAQTQVTFPLHRGSSHGQPVWYVITDASDRAYAATHRVNYVPKLAAARGTAAVQHATVRPDGTLDFPGTVTFGLSRVITPGCTPMCATNPLAAFPPSAFSYPAQGDGQYSPLIELPDGTVLNAPHVANATG